MEIKDKKILIYGLGITGISSIKALSKMGTQVYVYDSKDKKDLEKVFKDLEGFDYSYVEEVEAIDWKNLDYMLKSPGIRRDNSLVKLARDQGLEVVSDLELAYRIWGGSRMIAITGTNGKTTTTSLVAHILSQAGIKNHLVGNIGIGLLWKMYENPDDYFVLESSSFQLASVEEFNPFLGAIINISEDHLDWHGSYEDYISSKLNLARRMTENQSLILNYEDPLYDRMVSETRADIIRVSTKRKLEDGYYLDGKSLSYRGIEIINRDEISLVGIHNVENILFAIALTSSMNVDLRVIREAIMTFKGVAHRIEYVDKIKGVSYYNDSKGTNVDSTVNALRGFENQVILIAGGYDKNVAFDQIFEGRKNIKSLLLIGQTKYKLYETAKNHGVKNIELLNSLSEAVTRAYSLAQDGDVVLLSPACASWGMYDNFEQRGNDFKKAVQRLAERK